jgi:hypothetical protein
MMLLTMLLGWLLAGAALFALLRKKESRGERWRLALGIGAAVGLARAFLACAGALIVGHAEGWIGFPAYFLMLIAMPELALVPFTGSWLNDNGWALYARLAGLVVGCSIAVALGIALMVDARRPPGLDRVPGHSP